MTTISAKVVADSISPLGHRLVTIETRYPRFIHSEIMTHRVFSRNARSSRAVPVDRMLKEIMDDPVVPLFWGKNQKGMQASEECNELVTGFSNKWELTREEAWLLTRDYVVTIAEKYNKAGYHKQVINRIVEPFMHIDTLISSTEWSNFLALRDHHMAEPHFQVLAREISAELARSQPKPLWRGEWHLPYINDEERAKYDVDTLKKVSTARCARISYTPFDGNGSIEAEVKRHDDLVGAVPLHASPTEHQATPDARWSDTYAWMQPHLHGNFTGWVQYRKTLKGESQ